MTPEAADRLLFNALPMYELLNDLRDLLDDYSDVVDGDDGQPRPNRAMSALAEVDRLLAKIDGGQS